MNRILLIPSIALLLLFIIGYALSGGHIATPANSADRPIVFANADEVKTLDVGKMSWANDIRTAMGLWEGLVAYHPETLEILPGVAEKWEITPDGKTYTFHLRSSARWSNGDPVGARNFLFAWKRVLTPSTGADYINLFYPIAGAEAYSAALGGPHPETADFSTVGIHSPDDHTLIVQLAQPCTYFLDLCAFPPYYPLHEAAMQPFLLDRADPSKGYDARWTRPPHLITNGAFFLKDWQFKRELVLQPSPFYWDRAHVKATSLIVKAYEDPRTALLAYQEGRVDAMSFVPQQFGEELLAQQNSHKRNDIHFRPVFGTYYYILNCTRPPLTDKRVRKALALAIDKEQIVTHILRMGQKTVTQLVPPDSIPGYASPAGLPMDVEEARRLLADAGYPDGKGFPTLDLLYNNESIHLQVAQAIGQMWKNNLHIEISYHGLERGSFGTDRRTANFTIARGGWYGDYTDPTTWLDLFKTGDGNNDGRFSSPAYDALLEKAAAEPNPQKRFALLHDAERLLVEDEFPAIPLYQYSDGYIFDPDKVDNLNLNVRLLTQFKWLCRK